MLNKKQSSCVGFNPFYKFLKEKPSISTKIMNKLKSLFQINLNPSSCIQRELISQQTIYVPVDLEIVGAQTIEHDSIQICHSQSSIKQRRNKFMSFDDHLKEQQNTKLQQIEQSQKVQQKVQQKEEKHLKKFNQLALQKSFDSVLPENIDMAEIKENNIVIHPKRKLSSQQNKKRKLDQRKKQVEIKFEYKKHVYDQIQDSINESRIKEVPEQLSYDSLKDNSLLAIELKEEPQNKEIIIIQLDNENQKQPQLPIINEIIEPQQKGLKKSQSMINLNEQEEKSFSCSPKKIENTKQSDIINKPNEIQKDEVKKQIKKNDKLTEYSVQPQQTVINFLVKGSAEQITNQTKNNNTQLKKEVSEEKKSSELQERNINNFSDTPLFGFGKSSKSQQEQVIPNKINVSSSIFESYDLKDQNLQKTNNQCQGQDLQQNQFTFLQSKPKISDVQQQSLNNSEQLCSNVNNNKDSLDQQPKIQETKQINNPFNKTTENQNDWFSTKKQLLQNLINQPQSKQREQIEDNKQDQPEDNNKKPEIQPTQSNSNGLNFQMKSSSDDQINSELKQDIKQPSFSFLQQQLPKIENNKSDIFSTEQLNKQVTTPVKQRDNPFLQQSPKIDQEQIISYFSNHSQQQNRINQDESVIVQTSLFQNDRFKQQNNSNSMFNQQPQLQSTQQSIFQQLTTQQNQFLSNNNVFQAGVNNNINTKNNGMDNNMEITDMPLPPQKYQFTQQSQNSLNPFNQPQLGTNNFFPQIQQQISNGFNVPQYFQTQQQNEHQNQLFQLPQTNGIFIQDQTKSTNQSQSLNSSFQSRNGKRKQRIDQ